MHICLLFTRFFTRFLLILRNHTNNLYFSLYFPPRGCYNMRKKCMEAHMNLIPEARSGKTFDYFCTWSAQTRWGLPKEVNLGPQEMRDRLTEDFLFGEGGLLRGIDPAARGGLIAVLDDGWDVPAGSAPGKDVSVFGSLIVDEEKFPSCAGTPEERLKKLSDKVLSLGYAGLGLWVAVQIAGSREGEVFTDEEIYAYWAERARWCRAAGVKYWKCDWGRNARDARFRRLMTDAVKDNAPDLLIEHLYPIPDPLDSELPRDEAFAGRMALAQEFFRDSDALRTYDVALEFGVPSTLQRLADFCAQRPRFPRAGCAGVLNVEDCLYLAPGCGAAAGVMRVPLEDYQPRMARSGKMTELTRLLAWHRLCPPFCLGGASFSQSSERLVSSYTFPQDFAGWPDMHGQTVVQSAPAAMSFNVPLPEAQPDAQGSLPYLLACLNPAASAYALCVLPCTQPGRLYHEPLCRISLGTLDANLPIGLFGRYESCRLSFDSNVENRRVFVQDLAAREAVDVTDRVALSGPSLTLPGALVERLCAVNQPAGDTSSPAVVVTLA